MSEEDSPGLKFVEAHEMFIEHVEAGRTRIRILSLVTIMVAFILLATYFAQLLLPFTSGTRYLSLDLLSPTIVILQTFLVAVIFAWLYIAIVNYIFASRLGAVISEGRLLERELEKKALSREPLEGLPLTSRAATPLNLTQLRRLVNEISPAAKDAKHADQAGPMPAEGSETPKERLILLPKDAEVRLRVTPKKSKASEMDSTENESHKD